MAETPSQMPQDGPRPKKNTGVIILILIVIFLLLLEGALVATVMISPTASKTFAQKIDNFRNDWKGDEGEPGIATRASNALSGFYRNEILTLWADPEPTAAEPTFARCGSCHTDYEVRDRFTHVYMDHPLHAQEGIQCAVCHTMVEHPEPDRPAEAVCAGCHVEVNEEGGCDFCHPAGTLPHFYLLGAPREGYIDCATCHPQSSLSLGNRKLVHVGNFTGDPSGKCMKCHGRNSQSATDAPTTLDPRGCNSCHGDPHPDDWIRTHPNQALSGTVCTECHADVWCAMACHATTSTFRPPLIPLPSPSEVITP